MHTIGRILESARLASTSLACLRSTLADADDTADDAADDIADPDAYADAGLPPQRDARGDAVVAGVSRSPAKGVAPPHDRHDRYRRRGLHLPLHLPSAPWWRRHLWRGDDASARAAGTTGQTGPLFARSAAPAPSPARPWRMGGDSGAAGASVLGRAAGGGHAGTASPGASMARDEGGGVLGRSSGLRIEFARVDAARAPPDLEQSPDERMLSRSEWEALSRGAERLRYRRGQVVTASAVTASAGGALAGGAPPLLYVAIGVFRVQVARPDHPQDFVLRRAKPGHFLQTEGWLLHRRPTEGTRVVCESPHGVLVCLPVGALAQALAGEPALAARLDYALARNETSQLRHATSADFRLEVRLHPHAMAPRTIRLIAANPAFFLLLRKFILTEHVGTFSVSAMGARAAPRARAGSLAPPRTRPFQGLRAHRRRSSSHSPYHAMDAPPPRARHPRDVAHAHDPYA